MKKYFKSAAIGAAAILSGVAGYNGVTNLSETSDQLDALLPAGAIGVKSNTEVKLQIFPPGAEFTMGKNFIQDDKLCNAEVKKEMGSLFIESKTTPKVTCQ